MNKRRSALYLLMLIVLCGALLLWRQNADKLQIPSGEPAKSASSPATEAKPAGQDTDAEKELKKASIPKEASAPAASEGSTQLPPSPPLPQVSAEATQGERREAFQLNNSVDFIVRKDEPFEALGRQWTIEQLLQGVHADGKQPQLLHPIREADVGSAIRKPIAAGVTAGSKAPDYYAVRVIQPDENLWNIDFAVIQEYLARRKIILPATSDEPYPNGTSSGIGRLLKFIEGVVYVYNLQQNRIEKDLNVVHPQEILVFFKISDLFAALDRLQPEDLQQLRYVSNCLKLERTGAATALLDRRALRQ